jgi:transposase
VRDRTIGAVRIARLAHDVRLILPSYVKPFVKRQKNDAADAEAICEASQRPTMRFVPVKSEACQAAAVVFRARDLLVRQRTQIINALRGHLAEFGLVVAKGLAHVGRLIAQAADQSHSLPEVMRAVLGVLIETLHVLDEKVAVLDAEIAVAPMRTRMRARLFLASAQSRQLRSAPWRLRLRPL